MDVMFECVAGLDVHKAMIVACVRRMSGGKAERESRTFETTTSGLLDLLAWLTASRCSHVAMEATGVYWKPVWNILSDRDFELILANAAHIKNVPGRKIDVFEPEPDGSPLFTLLPLVACWREHLRLLAITRAAIPPSPLRDRVGSPGR